MYLTPREMERLTIFTAAEIARRRKDKGLKLNVPEAIAYITDAMIEGAREDKSVAQLMSEGATLLTIDDVLPGVTELIPLIQVEAHFADGTKLISIHNPIRSAGV